MALVRLQYVVKYYVIAKIDYYIDAKMKAEKANWEHLHKRSLADTTEGAVETEAAIEHPKKKPAVQQNSDLNDLGARHDLKEIQGTEGKVQKLLEIYRSKQEWGKLTSGAKTFVVKHLNPTMECLKHHFQGNVALFCERYPKFQHTTFPKLHCGGKGNSCAAKSAG